MGLAVWSTLEKGLANGRRSPPPSRRKKPAAPVRKASASCQAVLRHHREWRVFRASPRALAVTDKRVHQARVGQRARQIAQAAELLKARGSRKRRRTFMPISTRCSKAAARVRKWPAPNRAAETGKARIARRLSGNQVTVPSLVPSCSRAILGDSSMTCSSTAKMLENQDLTPPVDIGQY
jgi:hypothetical protein